MAKAEQLSSGKWRVKVYLGRDENRKQKFASVTADTKREAERRAALYNPSVDTVSVPNMSINECCNEFISLRVNVLSPWTVTTYKRYTNIYLASIGKVKVGKIAQKSVQEWVNDFSSGHKPKTVANAYGFLKNVLRTYRPDFDLNCIRLPEKIKPDINIPTDEEVMMAMGEANGPEMRLAISLCAGLGMRRGEICALHWSDISGSKVHIRRAMAKGPDGWKEKQPKTYAGDRTLDIPDSIHKQLLSLDRKSKDRIFGFTPDAITRRWERICKKTGIRCRFYDLRHYNASTMLALGIPDLYAMERMGHATPDMLKRVYQHIQDSKRKEVSNAMNAKMDSLLG